MNKREQAHCRYPIVLENVLESPWILKSQKYPVDWRSLRKWLLHMDIK